MAEYKATVEITINSTEGNIKAKELIDCDLKESIERICGSLGTTVRVTKSTLTK